MKHTAIAVVTALIVAGVMSGLMLAGCGDPQVIEVRVDDDQASSSPPVPTLPPEPTPDPSPSPLPTPSVTDPAAEGVLSYVRTDATFDETLEITLDSAGDVALVSWWNDIEQALETSDWQWTEADDGTACIYHEWTQAELDYITGGAAVGGSWVFYLIGDGDWSELYERGDVYTEDDEHDGWESYWKLAQ